MKTPAVGLIVELPRLSTLLGGRQLAWTRCWRDSSSSNGVADGHWADSLSLTALSTAKINWFFLWIHRCPKSPHPLLHSPSSNHECLARTRSGTRRCGSVPGGDHLSWQMPHRVESRSPAPKLADQYERSSKFLLISTTRLNVTQKRPLYPSWLGWLVGR